MAFRVQVSGTARRSGAVLKERELRKLHRLPPEAERTEALIRGAPPREQHRRASGQGWSLAHTFKESVIQEASVRADLRIRVSIERHGQGQATKARRT